jgi:selenide, water dikinase
LQPWIPQDVFLGIIGTGEKYAVASKGGMGVEGSEMWKLKEKIDRQWMEGLQTFPDMQKMMAERLNHSANEDAALSQVSRDSTADTLSLLFKPKMR